MGDRFNPLVRKIPWRRAWKPTPVLLPGESHGQNSLAGYSPWGHKESDTTEWLTQHTASYLFHTWQCIYVNATFSILPTLSIPPFSFLKQLGCSVTTLDSIPTCRMYWSCVQDVPHTPPPRGHGRKSGKREGFLLTCAEGRAMYFQSEMCFFRLLWRSGAKDVTYPETGARKEPVISRCLHCTSHGSCNTWSSPGRHSTLCCSH